MLFVVSVVTFAIFFLVPKLGGATPEAMAGRYVGRTATAETQKLMAERLGFNDSVALQYGRFIKGVMVGADFDTGTTIEPCPAPCFGYSFLTRQPVWPDLVDRSRVTFSLAVGAAVIWVIAGVATGVVSALKRGSIFDRTAMGIALGGVSLPIFFTGMISLVFFSYNLGWTAPGGAYVDLTVDPLRWAYSLLLP